MRLVRFQSLFLLSFAFLSTAHAEGDPNVRGLVTRVVSPADFDVDGIHVLVSPSTNLQLGHDSVLSPLASPAPFLGQVVNVWGHLDRKALSIASRHVVFYLPNPATISGSAIVDQVPSAGATFRRLRADGRMLEISTSVLDNPVPLNPGAPLPAGPENLRTNVWIDYHGQRRLDGVIAVDQATFADNSVVKSEGKLIKKNEYDPAAVSEDAHQSGVSKYFKGIDPKQIPPYKDDFLQARIDRIGETLIPAFQRALADNDPTRIHFRFQLVDEPKWGDAHTLPSGIILVPHQIVRRLPDDAELAAVLADNIGTALEKQTYRQQGSRRKLTAANIAGAAAGIVIPGADIVAGLTTYGIGKSMLTHAEEQSGRVALTLMHDAGYDLAKAPEAWWILATKDGDDPHRKSPPPRAVNQYLELGTTWHNAAAEPFAKADPPIPAQ
jgi:hypothetical protein